MVAVEKLWTDIYYPFYVYKLEAKDCKLYLICLFCILQNKLSYKELYMLLDEGTCLFNFNPNEVCSLLFSQLLNIWTKRKLARCLAWYVVCDEFGGVFWNTVHNMKLICMQNGNVFFASKQYCNTATLRWPHEQSALSFWAS